MTTFILLSITAAVFYYLGTQEQEKRINQLKDYIKELRSEIIVQKEINK